MVSAGILNELEKTEKRKIHIKSRALHNIHVLNLWKIFSLLVLESFKCEGRYFP